MERSKKTQITVNPEVLEQVVEQEASTINTDPEPFDQVGWPTLDGKALNGFAGRFVDFAKQNNEGDPAAILFTFLVRFSIEVGRSPHLMVGDATHHTNEYVVIVGNSSKARKGTSAKPVERLFENLENIARLSPGPLSSGEGLIYAVRDEIQSWVVDRKNGDGEWKTTDPGIDDKRLFVMSEEFGSVLDAARREGNSISAIIRTLYDTGNVDPLTKSSKIKTTGTHFGYAAHITQHELHQKLSESDSLNGFGNRNLWVCARRSQILPMPKPMSSRQLERFQGELKNILAFAKDVEGMEWSSDARELWWEKYEGLTKEIDGLYGTLIARSEAHAVRLAMIYALLDKSKMITKPHLEAALAAIQYSNDSAKFIFDEHENDPISEKIMNALQSNKDGLTATQISEVFGRNLESKVIQSHIKKLISSGKIDAEKKRGAYQRKPTTYYKIRI